MSYIWPGRSEYPFINESIPRLIIDEPSLLDIGSPEGRCGVQFWVEFLEKKKAMAFRTALYEFARNWDPHAPD